MPNLAQRLTTIEGKVDKIMAAKDDILDLCNQMKTALDAIATKEANSLTPAEVQVIKDNLTSVVQAAQKLV